MSNRWFTATCCVRGVGEVPTHSSDQLNDVAAAIDGDIDADPGYQPVRADSQVHLVPRIAGG